MIMFILRIVLKIISLCYSNTDNHILMFHSDPFTVFMLLATASSTAWFSNDYIDNMLPCGMDMGTMGLRHVCVGCVWERAAAGWWSRLEFWVVKVLIGDLLAAGFVKGCYCAYPIILTVVITGVGQLITTLVLETSCAAARNCNEVRKKNHKTVCETPLAETSILHLSGWKYIHYV